MKTKISLLGIDIGKNLCSLVGLDASGAACMVLMTNPDAARLAKLGMIELKRSLSKPLKRESANSIHWSTRDMARAAGTSASSVHRAAS
jgi:hypothetical protein